MQLFERYRALAADMLEGVMRVFVDVHHIRCNTVLRGHLEGSSVEGKK